MSTVERLAALLQRIHIEDAHIEKAFCAAQKRVRLVESRKYIYPFVFSDVYVLRNWLAFYYAYQLPIGCDSAVEFNRYLTINNLPNIVKKGEYRSSWTREAQQMFLEAIRVREEDANVILCKQSSGE